MMRSATVSSQIHRGAVIALVLATIIVASPMIASVGPGNGRYLNVFASPTSTPLPVNQIVTDVLQASPNSALIVIPDYTFTQFQSSGQYHTSAQKCHGTPAAVTDSYAAMHLTGDFANSQNVILDTNPTYVSQANCGYPNDIIPISPLVAIAGPMVNEVVYYYTMSTTQSQLYFDLSKQCIVRRDTSASVACNPSSSTQDTFVIEAFRDSQARSVYLLWGRGYYGTLAAAVYSVSYIAKNSSAYDLPWYVYNWSDASSGVSNNGIPDSGDSFVMVANANSSSGINTPNDPTSPASLAWRYFAYGNGINPSTKLPRGWIGGNWFNFWDLGMALDGTVAGHKAGLIGSQEYQTRIGALLSFLENIQLSSDGTPYYSYRWDTGAPASSQGMDAADSGRTLNGLGFLRRSDPSYASRIDNLLTGRLKPWMDKLSNWGLTIGVYGRDVALALQYFRYLGSQYDKSTWLSDFYSAWTSSNRITDAYGNSMPQLSEVNMGPVSYELLEKGEDYAHTLVYSTDMRTWAQRRDQATSKYSLWGSELAVKLSGGSTSFAWEFYVALVPNVGYKTWQVKLIDGRWFNENDTTIASTLSSVDVAYTFHAIFGFDSWVESVFPRFEQADLTASTGFSDGVFEALNSPETTVCIPHNAVVLLAAIA